MQAWIGFWGYLGLVLALNYWLSDRPPGVVRMLLPFVVAAVGTAGFQYGVYLSEGHVDKFFTIAVAVQFSLSVVIGFVGVGLRGWRRSRSEV